MIRMLSSVLTWLCAYEAAAESLEMLYKRVSLCWLLPNASPTADKHVMTV